MKLDSLVILLISFLTWGLTRLCFFFFTGQVHYAATYHHLSPEEVLGLSDFEEEWNAEVSAYTYPCAIAENMN